MPDLKILYDEALRTKKLKALMDLKTEIVTQHGKAGIVYLLQKENLGTISFLEDTKDSSCPWFQYKDQAVLATITDIWAPLKDKLPTFLDLLKTRCQHLLTIENNGAWQLVYVVKALLEDGSPFFLFYNGEMPVDAEMANDRPTISSKYQEHLGLFYQIHNGFGELYRESLLPLDELSRIKVADEFYWSFFDFVSKARQCIKASDLALTNPITYDHDRGNIQAYHPFWKFLDERLAIIDEE